MLTETNLGGIIDSILQWSQRKNIDRDIINDFVEIALSTATRSLRIPPLEALTSVAVNSLGYFELPSDFQEAKELSIIVNNKTVILERKAINEVDYRYNLSPGDPCIFGRVDNFMRIAPWGGAEGNANLYYYKIIPAMPSETSTNWFTLYAPEILLYGGLAELAKYTRDDEGKASWSAEFNKAINTLQAVEDRSAWSGSTISVSLGGSS